MAQELSDLIKKRFAIRVNGNVLVWWSKIRELTESWGWDSDKTRKFNEKLYETLEEENVVSTERKGNYTVTNLRGTELVHTKGAKRYFFTDRKYAQQFSKSYYPKTPTLVEKAF